MIPTRRSEWFNAWFSWTVEGRIAKTFSQMRIRNIDAVRAAAKEGSVLVIANHTAWWDPMFPIFFFTRVVKLFGYCMMDVRNMRRLPFLGRVGAFGVDLEDPADGARAIRYASKRLLEPNNVVFVFPQGAERPLTEPLQFKTGAAAIARVSKCTRIFPLALRYEFGKDERPVFWASFGDALHYERDVEAGALAQQRAVEAELQRIDRTIRTGVEVDTFAVVVEKPVSALSRFAERFLAWLTRGAVREDRRDAGA